MRVFVNTGFFSVADAMYQLYRRTCVTQSESATSESFFVNNSVQIGKSVGEFDLFAIDSYRTKRTLTLGTYLGRQIIFIDRQEPFDLRLSNSIIPPVRVLLAACTSLYWTFPNSQIRIS